MKQITQLFKGISASPGKIYGPTLKIISSNHLILETIIDPKKIKSEIHKFQTAIDKTKKELDLIVEKNSVENDDLKEILVAQMCMLEDPLLINGVKSRIESKFENAPLALFHEIERISKEFEDINDEYIRERATDIRDIGKRIENNLLGKRSDYHILSELKSPVIIVAHELTPSQMLHMDKSFIKGIASEKGGRTGHMAILAKHFEIPAVVGIKGITSEIQESEFIFLDGDSGTICKNPNISQIKNYGFSEAYPKLNILEKFSTTCHTRDREKIHIKVNLESYEDCKSIIQLGAEGVGLFRTETLMMESSNHNLSEEDQFQIYKKIAIGLEGKQFIIRTFDVGADKIEMEEPEDNPFLGNRGIRYSLRNQDKFKKQLKAILRATLFGNIAIMFPMITQLSEFLESKKVLAECKNELSKRGIKFKNPKLGIMVETPACAISLEIFSNHCDFFSVGTNDLLQYFMAVDRNNSDISELYNPLNYSFLKTLKNIADVSHESKTPLSLCGELASDLNFTILLIGLGFRELSVAIPMVKKIKKLISGIDLSQAKRLTDEVLKLSKEEKFSEIESYLFNLHLLN